MANETFDGIARKLRLRVPTVSILLAQDWIRDAWRDVVNHRRWSWLIRRGQLFTTDVYSVGTASVSAGASVVTLAGGAVVDPSMIGRQFRGGNTLPILTITAVDAVANTLTLSDNWWPTSLNGTYKIYTAYPALPTDFHSLISITDPAQLNPIDTNKSVAFLDKIDPQRASTGSLPRYCVPADTFNDVQRYEMWPHQMSARVYPIVYTASPVDAFDAGSSIPSDFPADILLERALMYCAGWPGFDKDNPNPYFNPQLVGFHQKNYDTRLVYAEMQDNERYQQDLWYQSDEGGGNARPGANWLQSHAVY